MKREKRIRGLLGAAALAVTALGVVAIPRDAEAARCAADGGGNWSCTHSKRTHWYFCNGVLTPRVVRWQVPEGAPPPGGWPVAFYYTGTQPTDTSSAFKRSVGESFGAEYEPQILHELLDDPAGTGKKYAVIAPDPPASAVFMQFWNTNAVNPYSVSCDHDFFPDFFGEIEGGSYGPASQYDMERRFAYGISSGGYNTSRMAVTFNSGAYDGDTWRALAVIAASYATCAGALCSVPALPANHPPTKFWHGHADLTVPIATMNLYYSKLLQGGFTAQKVEHPFGHQLTAHNLGPTGIKAWFDLYY